MSFTPGPWVDAPMINTWKHRVFANDGLKLVAQTSGRTLKNHNEDHANARLIAQAPALLEALKDMVRYLDNNGKESDVSEATRAVIAAAEDSPVER